ncbi:hypothetical protein KR059_009179, partial [Drosophila kikkawai]
MIFDLLLPLAILFALVSAYNYCDNKTHACNELGFKHFICQLDDELPSHEGTKFEGTVPDTQHFQKEVLGLLNDFRNHLASGEVMNNANRTFPSARRMRRLIWDNELAYLARVHASTVSFKHTMCRSTLRFPDIGEVMAIMAAPVVKKLTVSKVLRNAFRSMWKQHWKVESPDNLINQFDAASAFLAADFANIINDRVSRVGCSVAVGSNCPYAGSLGFFYFLTCYFDNTNIVNAPIYKPGVPTSGCDEWEAVPSIKWSYLCKNLGLIFPNVSGRVL